jgi:hypothetical protein
MAAPTGETINAGCYVNVGDVIGQERIVQSKSYSTTLTANVKEVVQKKYAASAADQQLDLTAFCTTLRILTIEDLGTTGLDVGIGGTANKMKIGAGCAVQIGWRTTETPPVLYITNPDGVNAAYVAVGVVGDFS